MNFSDFNASYLLTVYSYLAQNIRVRIDQVYSVRYRISTVDHVIYHAGYLHPDRTTEVVPSVYLGTREFNNAYFTEIQDILQKYRISYRIFYRNTGYFTGYFTEIQDVYWILSGCLQNVYWIFTGRLQDVYRM